MKFELLKTNLQGLSSPHSVASLPSALKTLSDKVVFEIVSRSILFECWPDTIRPRRVAVSDRSCELRVLSISFETVRTWKPTGRNHKLAVNTRPASGDGHDGNVLRMRIYICICVSLVRKLIMCCAFTRWLFFHGCTVRSYREVRYRNSRKTPIHEPT